MTKQEATAIDIVIFLAKREDPDPVNGAEIHEKLKTPMRFAEHTMQKLSRAGIIKSKRGPVGGYRFSGDFETTISAVLSAVGDQHSRGASGFASQVVAAYLDNWAAKLTVGELVEANKRWE